jgi:hypothetical protein
MNQVIGHGVPPPEEVVFAFVPDHPVRIADPSFSRREVKLGTIFLGVCGFGFHGIQQACLGQQHHDGSEYSVQDSE